MNLEDQNNPLCCSPAKHESEVPYGLPCFNTNKILFVFDNVSLPRMIVSRVEGSHFGWIPWSLVSHLYLILTALFQLLYCYF